MSVVVRSLGLSARPRSSAIRRTDAYVSHVATVLWGSSQRHTHRGRSLRLGRRRLGRHPLHGRSPARRVGQTRRWCDGDGGGGGSGALSMVGGAKRPPTWRGQRRPYLRNWVETGAKPLAPTARRRMATAFIVWMGRAWWRRKA